MLSTRAGTAPNKHKKNNNIESPCLYPFTDLIVYPNGSVGMCCNDCFEVTNMGNVNHEDIRDIWIGEKFTELRLKMKSSRMNSLFCSECDVVDAGYREKEIANQ